MKLNNAQELLEIASKRGVLVIGDSIVDVTITFDRAGYAAEDATVPRCINTGKVMVNHGGAGGVVESILALGGSVTYVAVLGANDESKHYTNWAAPGLTVNYVVDPGRVTVTKTRYWIRDAGSTKFYLYVTAPDQLPLDSLTEQRLLDKIESTIRTCAVVVIADYLQGMLTQTVIEGIRVLAEKYSKPVFVDSQAASKPSNHKLYSGVSLMLLNEKEARAVDPAFNSSSQECLSRLGQKLSADIIVKRGAQGSAALLGGRYFTAIPPQVKSIDTCGAGDAFLAVIALVGLSRPQDALNLANAWAALSTTIRGTTPPTKEALYQLIEELQ